MGFREDALNNMFKWLPPRMQLIYKSLSQVFDAAIAQAAAAGPPSIDDKDFVNADLWQDSSNCG